MRWSFPRGLEHLRRLARVERRRLLAQHVLAGPERRERLRQVERRRRGHHHEVELGQGEQRVEVGEPVRHGELLRECLRAILVAAQQPDDLDAGGGLEAGDLGRAGEARADDPDADGALAHGTPRSCWVRRAGRSAS
jgi:hypothetical protein